MFHKPFAEVEAAGDVSPFGGNAAGPAEPEVSSPASADGEERRGPGNAEASPAPLPSGMAGRSSGLWCATNRASGNGLPLLSPGVLPTRSATIRSPRITAPMPTRRAFWRAWRLSRRVRPGFLMAHSVSIAAPVVHIEESLTFTFEVCVSSDFTVRIGEL